MLSGGPVIERHDELVNNSRLVCKDTRIDSDDNRLQNVRERE